MRRIVLAVAPLLMLASGCKMFEREERFTTWCDSTGCYFCDESGCRPIDGRPTGDVRVEAVPHHEGAFATDPADGLLQQRR